MDTNKLRVGQKLQMQSGSLTKDVVVRSINDEFVVVNFMDDGQLCAIFFTLDGKKQVCSSGYGPDGTDPRPVNGEKGIPWALVDSI